MSRRSKQLYKIAWTISALGHPLFTTGLFVLFISFHEYSPRQAFFISLLIIGGLLLPLAIRNFRKVKKGEYTNFDVSDQKQRNSLYVYMIATLTLITGILFALDQPPAFCMGALCTLCMVIVSYAVNFIHKTSLHTAMNLFWAFAIYELFPGVAYFFACWAALVALSRLVLQRHTLPEVLSGAFIGGVCGFVTLLLIHPA